MTFENGSEEFDGVTRTVNGKSTLNIVRTRNEIRRGLEGPQYRIKGGDLMRAGENLRLRFAIVEAWHSRCGSLFPLVRVCF